MYKCMNSCAQYALSFYSDQFFSLETESSPIWQLRLTDGLFYKGDNLKFSVIIYTCAHSYEH